ncbi:DUF2865 domain-containing protein [Pelagibacterium lentulum]|nr:DUF2865 domain-containing protein [Pelagibacterium lentulum]
MGRLAVLSVVGSGLVLGNVGMVLAQNQSCTQIANMLRSIDNNRSYANYEAAVSNLRLIGGQVQQAESQFVRFGCQVMLNSGQQLSRECMAVAQTITSGRTEVQRLTAMAREGQSLAQNRQALLQDYARFNCRAGGGSGVTITRQTNDGLTRRGNLLQEIFGVAPEADGIDFYDDFVDPWTSMQTRRTVCVRTTDGYFWPISFATSDDYIAQDAIKCHEMCPGSEVILFSYRNPGEEPEDMISLSGVPYRSTPYAFAYRENFDSESSCQPRPTTGIVTLADRGGQNRSIISLEDLAFPLPQRDPRIRAAATPTVATAPAALAEAAYVPLPRPRPREDGSAPVTPTTSTPNSLRIIEMNNRPVRIVGPQTPFAPEPAGET